jgi:hypothetical protein
MRRHLLAFSIGILFIQGCAVHELRSDQERIRATLVELNTNQVLDNLVRASKGLPIIQIDYTNASASVTLEETANISDAVTTTNATGLMSTIAKVGAAATTSFAVTAATLNTLIPSMTALHTNQIGISGTPVLTSNELYDAYLAYLGEPGRLQVTACPPAPGEAHLCKRYHKCYYWVPVHAKEAFYELATVVTAQRDRMLRPPDDYVVILDGSKIDRPTPKKKGEKTGFEFVATKGLFVAIDKAVPNPDSGGIVKFAADGSTTPFLQYQGDTSVTDKHPTTYLKTTKLLIIYDSKQRPLKANNRDELEALLRTPPYQSVSLIYNDGDIRPSAPTTSELLDRIEFRHPQVQFPPKGALSDGKN